MFNLPFNPDRPLDRYSSRIGVMMSAAVISLLVCLPGSGAIAQEDASEDVVDGIVITGSRRQGRSPTDLPVPVDIIGADQLINQGPSNISELLRTATGASFVRYRVRCVQPGSRGASVRVGRKLSDPKSGP